MRLSLSGWSWVQQTCQTFSNFSDKCISCLGRLSMYLRKIVKKELADGSSPAKVPYALAWGVQSDDFFCGQRIDFTTYLVVQGSLFHFSFPPSLKCAGPVEQMKSGMAPGSAFVLKDLEVRLWSDACNACSSSVRNWSLFPVLYTPNATNSFDLRFTWRISIVNKCDRGRLGTKRNSLQDHRFLTSEISKTWSPSAGSP